MAFFILHGNLLYDGLTQRTVPRVENILAVFSAGVEFNPLYES